MADKKVVILINLLGLPWFPVCAAFFLWMLTLLRPSIALGFSFTLAPNLVVTIFVIVGVLLTFVLPIIIHELVHGLFFWLFTQARPTFGYKWWYAYASAPGWYFPRWQFLIVLLAPFVVLSLPGLALMPLVPDLFIPSLTWGLIINATGAIGDLYMIIRLALSPSGVVIEDRLDGIAWYVLTS
jgi:hypothetical protein